MPAINWAAVNAVGVVVTSGIPAIGWYWMAKNSPPECNTTVISSLLRLAGVGAAYSVAWRGGLILVQWGLNPVTVAFTSAALMVTAEAFDNYVEAPVECQNKILKIGNAVGVLAPWFASDIFQLLPLKILEQVTYLFQTVAPELELT